MCVYVCVYVCVLFYISLVLNCDAIEIYFKYATLQMGDIRGPFFPQVKYSITVYKIYKKSYKLSKKSIRYICYKIGPPRNNQWKNIKYISSHFLYCQDSEKYCIY